MNGILIIDKEKGYTSHDVVARLRRILGQKKIGHTGTLDPDACGVLPVCVGNATRLCDLLTDKTKEYEAGLLLGVTTDTQDGTGRVTGRAADSTAFLDRMPEPVAKQLTDLQDGQRKDGSDWETGPLQTYGSLESVSEERLRSIIMSFVGKGTQIPPMYSALKVNGKKLYELAREGKEIKRSPREIEIFKIEIREMKLPHVRFAVECSKGTYIRTLCEDIGQKAGCGGLMESLLRTRVDRFTLQDAVKLAEVEKLQQEGRIDEVLIPVDRMFAQYSKAVVRKECRKAVENGNALRVDMIRMMQDESQEDINFEEIIRVYDENGRFYGLYRAPHDGMMKPYKMFL